jgi:hypothetical protein
MWNMPTSFSDHHSLILSSLGRIHPSQNAFVAECHVRIDVTMNTRYFQKDRQLVEFLTPIFLLRTFLVVQLHYCYYLILLHFLKNLWVNNLFVFSLP